MNILFLCIHNSARSQMAEAYFNKFASASYVAESAGLEPGILNPLVVQVMKEDRIDISKNTTKDVFEFHRQGKTFDYVITVCDKEAAERCPFFPGVKRQLNWSFEDPSKFVGTTDERLMATRKVRDQIKTEVMKFVEELQKRESGDR